MVNVLRDASGSDAMPASEAPAKSGMIQVAGTVIAEG